MLCTAVLEDHFGYYVAEVGSALLGNQLPLPLIARQMKPKMTFREVRVARTRRAAANCLEFRGAVP